MVRLDHPERKGPRHRLRPAIERLECRQVLTTFFSPSYPSSSFGSSYSQQMAYRTALVRHEYHEFVSELQRIELRSQATPTQYLALRDDARAISEAASTTTQAPAFADQKALDASLQIDRSALEGWVGDPGWSEIRSRLGSSLDGLNVPTSLIDRTIADMRAVATSAGVTSDAYRTYTADFDRLRDGESSLPSGYGHFPDPGLYYTQHLRGFFRGGAVRRRADEAKLGDDLRAIGAEAHDTASAIATLRRDAQLLERIGAGLTTTANEQLGSTFVAAFDRGAPDAQGLADLQATFQATLATGGDGAALAAARRLVADAPAFYQAAGTSSSQIRTIVEDVRAVVADGAGSPLNPFKVQVVRPPSSR